MDTGTTSLPRHPDPRYMGANGFGGAKCTDPNALGSEDMTGHSLDVVLDEWRHAQFVFKHKKRELPDFETMKADVEKTTTGDDVKKLLAKLEQEHLKDLERLYEMQADEYLKEVQDVYASRDASQYKKRDQQEQTDEQKRLEAFFDGSIRPQLINQRWLSDHSRLRYNHLQRVGEILEAEKLRLKTFPVDPDDFRSRSKDIQIRVARFLVADRQRQERQMLEFKWTSMHVQPLVECFKKDEKFSSEIRAMVLSADYSVKDPRQRPT